MNYLVLKTKLLVIFLFLFITNANFAKELLPFEENFTKLQYDLNNQVWSNCSNWYIIR